MTPDTQDNNLATDQGGTPTPATPQQAAANVIRGQIDTIYGQTATDDPNPYDRTHTETVQPTAGDWQQYHSAWQDYYQKYYEGYYTEYLKHSQAANRDGSAFGSHPPAAVVPSSEMSKDEALYDLRSKLLSRVKTRAGKIRKSRHFIPILAGALVLLVFVFLQYNRVVFAAVEAYVVPGNANPQDLLIDPTANNDVGDQDLLIIPKISVSVPMIYGVGSDYNSQMTAMVKGVAEFAIPGASSVPGQIGNAAFAGHSSNDITDVGNYKYIFAKLDQMKVGDTIYVDYQGTRYIYTVTKTEVVNPNDVQALVYPTTQPLLTLITCTPLGTALNRLLVVAQQISPDPSTALPAPGVTSGQATTTIPGNSPTLLEKLFGAKD